MKCRTEEAEPRPTTPHGGWGREKPRKLVLPNGREGRGVPRAAAGREQDGTQQDSQVKLFLPVSQVTLVLPTHRHNAPHTRAGVLASAGRGYPGRHPTPEPEIQHPLRPPNLEGW